MIERRDVFPREADRDVLKRFLAGGPNHTLSPYTLSNIDLMDGRVRLVDGIDNAWIGPDGSVMVMIGVNVASGLTVRLINYLAEMLGMDDRVERETTPVGERARFTWAGSYVDVGQPFMLVGRLGLAAYRAGLGARARAS